MAAERMLISLNPAAVSAVKQLMDTYGEPSPEAMIMRALGFLQSVQPYLDDGAVTLFNPQAADDRDLIQLVFENARRAHAQPKAAH
jgi:hypothetical protein